jgi:hypothetical protein
MFAKGSRYESARAFDADSDGEIAFKGVRPREIGVATGVVEHIVKSGDRTDLLGRNYYNNDRLWWRLLDANPDVLFGGDLHQEDTEGEVVLVPKAKE